MIADQPGGLYSYYTLFECVTRTHNEVAAGILFVRAFLAGFSRHPPRSWVIIRLA